MRKLKLLLILNWLYCVIWYNFQWFIKVKALRRPFTYTLRDFGCEHPYIFWPASTGLFYLAYWLGRDVTYIGGFFFAGLLWALQAHLWWGSEIKKGQQEEPEYEGRGMPQAD